MNIKDCKVDNVKMRYTKVILTSFIILICYYISLKYIFPGYFNPLIPHHSDIFDYYYDMQNHNLIDFIKASRITGDFIISSIGGVDYRYPIILGIILTFINQILLISISRYIFKCKYQCKNIIVFCILIFAHPAFYINYTFDIYSTISFTFVMLVMFFWYTRKQLNKGLLIKLSVFTLLCFTTKETYIVSLLAFWFFQCLLNKEDKRKYSLNMLILTLIIAVLTLIRSKLFGSAFVSLGNNAHDAYYTTFNLKIILKNFIYYFKGSINIVSLVMIAIILFLNIKNSKKILNCIMLIAMGACAYLPYSVLPNHIVPHYQWLGVPIIYSIIFACEIDKEKVNNKIIFFSECFLVIIVMLQVFTNVGYMSKYQENTWAIRPEIINKNIMKSLEYIEENIKPSEKVLITGLYESEETPFKSMYYMKNRLGFKADITVITTREEDNNTYVKRKNINSINLQDYDKIFTYSNEGTLIKMYNKEEIIDSVNSDENESSILYPDILDLLNEQKDDPNNWYANLMLGKKYLEVKDFKNAQTYLEKSIDLSNKENPYPYYFMGQLMEQLNKHEEALKHYKIAYSIEKNENFQKAIDNIEIYLKH